MLTLSGNRNPEQLLNKSIESELFNAKLYRRRIVLLCFNYGWLKLQQ